MGFKVEETEDDMKLGYKTFIPEPVDTQMSWQIKNPAASSGVLSSRLEHSQLAVFV
jgi:hypothetical protein